MKRADYFPTELLTRLSASLTFESWLDRPSQAKPSLCFAAFIQDTPLPFFNRSHWRYENEDELRALESELATELKKVLPTCLREAFEQAFGVAYERVGGNEPITEREKGKSDKKHKREIAAVGERRTRKMLLDIQGLPYKQGRPPKTHQKQGIDFKEREKLLGRVAKAKEKLRKGKDKINKTNIARKMYAPTHSNPLKALRDEMKRHHLLDEDILD